MTQFHLPARRGAPGLTRRGALQLLAAVAATAAGGNAAAHPGHASSEATNPAAPPPVAASRLRAPLPDVRVTDAEQRRRRLVSDVFARRVVAIDFVLTDCSAMCGIVSAAMAGAQDLLAPRLATEAGLVSIALDPIGGTPEELRHYAARFGAGPNWSFLHLRAEALDEVLRRLDGPVPGGDHAPMVLVLDAARNEVRRLNGLPSPERIAAAVEAALAARTRA